ncbi:hypothetical protein ACM42_24040 [Bradyrhizobium sp. CCBAU 25338]|nr:hypothetical protein [Bradyrhizobium sp. CCBAU 25338]
MIEAIEPVESAPSSAIAAESITHSHSIVEQEVSSLFYKHKSPHLTDISRRYIRCNFSILNSQDNLRCLKYRQYRYLSESID